MALFKSIPVLALVALSAACGAAPDPEGDAREGAARTDESALISTPAPAITLKSCIAGPYTTYADGDRCPSYGSLASTLCTLGAGFTGGEALSHSCEPLPGSVPQLYSYSLTYECFRAAPCR